MAMTVAEARARAIAAYDAYLAAKKEFERIPLEDMEESADAYERMGVRARWADVCDDDLTEALRREAQKQAMRIVPVQEGDDDE